MWGKISNILENAVIHGQITILGEKKEGKNPSIGYIMGNFAGNTRI